MSGSRRRRRWRSSARTRSARRPTRPRRSSSRSSSAGRHCAALQWSLPVAIAIAGPAGGRRIQLSPGLHRLPDRRRLVLGLEGELRSARVAGRRVGAAHRLQPDRRGLDLVGGRADRVGVPGARPMCRPDRRRRRSGSSRSPTCAACARPATSSRSRPTCSCSAPSLMIAIGAYRIIVLGEHQRAAPGGRRRPPADTAGAASIFLLLRAFAVGRRGADRHRGDRDRRARHSSRPNPRTPRRPWWSWPASWPSCSSASRSWPRTSRSSRSRTARRADRHRPGRRRPSSAATRSAFYLFQAFTALLLFLAANTSFAAFPRLAAVLAEDGFFPRQFAFRGDRLAFSMGIVAAGPDRRVAGGHRRRQDPRADPALRGRRVHRLHDQPGRHGPALAAHRCRGWRYRLVDQRHRLRRDRRSSRSSSPA